MTFRAGDRVEITECEADPWAAGKSGRVLDDLAPGQLAPSDLTGGRWTVRVDGLFGPSALCRSYEMRKVG
ncbi:hypothetical protein ACW14Y_42925 [Kitasatospora sp. cg17-2]